METQSKGKTFTTLLLHYGYSKQHSTVLLNMRTFPRLCYICYDYGYLFTTNSSYSSRCLISEISEEHKGSYDTTDTDVMTVEDS